MDMSILFLTILQNNSDKEHKAPTSENPTSMWVYFVIECSTFQMYKTLSKMLKLKGLNTSKERHDIYLINIFTDSQTCTCNMTSKKICVSLAMTTLFVLYCSHNQNKEKS